MREITCINCNVVLCYLNDNCPTGFFYCAECKEREENANKDEE